MTRTWDIFCSVVDNYGDIGVCWRLARQLALELHQSVRLWVDDLAAFQHICARVDSSLDTQCMDGVEVRRWDPAVAISSPADIVVEGFGVQLPASYLAAMSRRSPPPVWINLEHLSAEPWVDGCHGLPSPQPRLPLTKHFFFPGFTEKTGGLLMERELMHARASFQSGPAVLDRFWRSLGIVREDTPLRVSLFCYDNTALPALVDAWASASSPVICVVPAGGVLTQLSAIVGQVIEPGTCAEQGRLTIAAIPFLDFGQYDRLLWACDVNFVRGEDSFVRAQLAARPLIWQAYVQEEGAHLAKLAAFLERYTVGMDATAAAAVRSLNAAWNRQSPEIAECWKTFAHCFPTVAAHAQTWSGQLARGGNLAIKLAEFCQDRLK